MKEIVPKKVGRPRAEIDRKLVIKLAAIHCTNEEIADIVGCTQATLLEHFCEDIKQAKSFGKASLRRKMWRAAQEGDRIMLIWLSKQLLGMKENSALYPEPPEENDKSDPMTMAISKDQALALLLERKKNVP